MCSVYQFIVLVVAVRSDKRPDQQSSQFSDHRQNKLNLAPHLMGFDCHWKYSALAA
jgi:hypothetical protein